MDSVEIVLRDEIKKLKMQLQDARRLLRELRMLFVPLISLDEIDEFMWMTRENDDGITNHD